MTTPIENLIAVFPPAVRPLVVELPAGSGRHYVRAGELFRALSDMSGIRTRLERTGAVKPLRVPCAKSKTEPHGVRVYYPLESVAAVLAWYRTRRRRWTATEIETVRRWVGIKSDEEIGRMLGRSAMAIQFRRQISGGIRKNAQKHHGLITCGTLARLMGRSAASIRDWVARGCPAQRMPNGKDFLFRLPAVREWLKTRWQLCTGLTPRVLAVMRLALVDGRVADAQVRGAA